MSQQPICVYVSVHVYKSEIFFYYKIISFSFLEGLSLFVACLCHDLDHRGTTSAFQVTSVSHNINLYINYIQINSV